MDDFKRKRRKGFEDLFDDDMFDVFDHNLHKKIHERIDRMMRDMTEEINEVNFDPQKSFVYGFSMQTGPDGKPIFEEFGNIPKEGVAKLPGEREPLVDIIKVKDEIKVIAELPGVEKKDIDLEATENSLSIRVDTLGRKYHKELRMPELIDPSKIKANYKNGILEVSLKPKIVKNQSKKIQID